MTFEMWSLWHYLYIISPFAVFFVIYILLRKRSDRAKNTVGYVYFVAKLINRKIYKQK